MRGFEEKGCDHASNNFFCIFLFLQDNKKFKCDFFGIYVVKNLLLRNGRQYGHEPFGILNI